MRVNEVFYSIQGEGVFTGTPAIFIRLAGCNLKCPFCDTKHEPYDVYSERDLAAMVAQYPAEHVVITGGEPTLQLTASFIDMLHDLGKYVQIETNGTQKLDDDLLEAIDWITCSPKFEYCKHAELHVQRIDELKVVYQGQDMSIYDDIHPEDDIYYVQPCDVQDEEKNREIINKTLKFIKENPQWKLSLQTQKILNVR